MNYLTIRDIKIPGRVKTAKKGDSGKLLVVAGSELYPGAAALASLAALRTGVDWVTVMCPEKVAWSINALTPDIVTFKLKGKKLSKSHSKKIIEESIKYNTILFGNGTGQDTSTIKCIKQINKEIHLPKVIDADGIKALSLEEIQNTILTPHKKELEILLSNSFVSNKTVNKIMTEKNIEKQANLIKKTINSHSILNENNKTFFENNNVLLLKGPTDTIITKNKTYYNKTGNPGMTKAGTGDVLAGLCAGFLTQTYNLTQSAINAAYINGQIGDLLLKKKKGYTYLASDMVKEIKQFTEI